VHRTYRWLDAPPRLFGLSFRQWLVLVLAVGAGYGLVKVLHVPAKVAVSSGVFVIGLPAALAYLSEGDGLPAGRLLGDAIVWLGTRGVLQPGACVSSRRLPLVYVSAYEDGSAPVEDAPTDDSLLEQLLGDGRWGA
jgi:hypothetical protein